MCLCQGLSFIAGHAYLFPLCAQSSNVSQTANIEEAFKCLIWSILIV